MKRNIFIITLGETAPVVTETVYALMSRDPPWTPTEIHIVTHAIGRNRCRGILTGPRSQLAAIFSAKKRRPIEPAIHVPQTKRGEEIADILTEADNIAFANTLTRLIKTFSEHDNTAIHVSLSGGRKTMSAHAALAISLFGREQDELSHVLVHPLEIQRRANNFFWPEQETQVLVDNEGGALTDSTGQGIVARSVSITLANTPFVRLNGILKEVPFPGNVVDYARIVELVQLTVGVRSIAIVSGERRVAVGPYSVRLGQAEFAFYRLIATASRELWEGAGPDGYGRGHYGWLTYDQILDPKGRALKLFFVYLEEAYVHGVNRFEAMKDFIMTQINEAETAKSAQKRQAAKAAVRARFSQLKARINRRFREHIPNHTLRGLATVALEDNGAISRFGITIAPNQIRQTDAN